MRPHEIYFVLCVALISVLFFTLGCDFSNDTTSENRDEISEQLCVQGRIIDVQPSSIFGLKSLTIVDDQGKEWGFEGRGITVPGFNASHLRDHMILGLPVSVTYKKEGDVLLIGNIDDVPTSEQP